MSSINLKLSESVDIDFSSILKKWVEDECLSESKEIVEHYISKDELLSSFDLLRLYQYHLEDKSDKFLSHLSWLKWQLVKEEKMKENGCFSPE